MEKVIRHKCGHVEIHQMEYTDMTENQLEENDCSECWVKDSYRQRNNHLVYPQLINGSNRQRVWAEAIRVDVINKILEYKPLMHSIYFDTYYLAEILLNDHVDAEWWIENRWVSANEHWNNIIIPLSINRING